MKRVFHAYFSLVAATAMAAPLPSWNDTAPKRAVLNFVERVTREGSADFVPPARRIAVFDNDGTLWGEQPFYFQALFALARVQALVADHPEWRDTDPFKSALAGDIKGVLATGREGLEMILTATHANLSAEDFEASVRDWLAKAKHPTTGRTFTRMVFQPMLELLEYLRAEGFKCFIVSGGGIDFMRVFAEETYGIPPEQVIGTTTDAQFEIRHGVPTIIKTGKLVLVDDKTGKPIGIYRHIGRRPILAAGNSDGDLEMLQYTTIPRNRGDTTPRFGLIVRHTDAAREWAYDRESHVGRLDAALEEAPRRGWMVIDMKNDWNRIYPE
jgi:phosphoglycolate phosphatase-like HAD superfamily hydrolase